MTSLNSLRGDVLLLSSKSGAAWSSLCEIVVVCVCVFVVVLCVVSVRVMWPFGAVGGILSTWH